MTNADNSLIYNNYFNNTANALVYSNSTGTKWNTTPTTGTNIVGGPNLGGNFWATPTGTGWSQTHTGNADGFTIPYTVSTGNIDQHPLAIIVPTPIPALYLLNSNETDNRYYTINGAAGNWVINESGHSWQYDLLAANNSINFNPLTNTYTNFGPGFALLINASNVIFDGMGAILNGGGHTEYGIIVNNQTAANYNLFSSDPGNALGGISITNITLLGFTQAGIFFNNVVGTLPAAQTASEITDVNADYNYNIGIVLMNSESVTLEGNAVTGFGDPESGWGDGISLVNSTNNTLVNNQVSGVSRTGFHLDNSDGNNLTGNEAVGNWANGFMFVGSRSNISGNSATGNHGAGYYLSNSMGSNLTGNSATSNWAEGFSLDHSASTLTGNDARNNMVWGYSLESSGSSRLAGNNATNNLGDGFHIINSGGVVLIGNNATENRTMGSSLAIQV